MRRRIQAPSPSDGMTADIAPTEKGRLDIPSGESPLPFPLTPLPLKRKLFSSKRTRFFLLLAVVLAVSISSFGLAWMLLRWLFPKHRFHHLLEIPQIKTLLEDAPAPVGDDEYVVFVSNSNGKARSRYNVAFAMSRQSAEDALLQSLEQIPLRSARYKWFKIDVVTAVRELKDYDSASKHNDIPSWWYGLALDWTNRWIFLPDQVQAHGLVDWKNRLLWDRVSSFVAQQQQQQQQQQHLFLKWPSTIKEDDSTVLSSVQVLHTNAILCDFSSKQVIPLYHGHRSYPKLTHGLLLDAAQRAGDYLARNTRANGTMLYLYKPQSDYEDIREYGLTRHAGTVFAMAALYPEYQTKPLLEALQRAMRYLSTFVHDCLLVYHPKGDPNGSAKPGMAKCVWDFDKGLSHYVTKLGLNALTVLAMAEYTKATSDTQYLPTAKAIADWIVSAQKKDASFVQKVQEPENILDEDYYVRYYQGEVAFALARLANVLHEQQSDSVAAEKFRACAELTATHIVEREMKLSDEEMLLDHWLLVALSELKPASRHHKKHVAYAKRSIELTAAHQVQETSPQQDKDRLGIFGGSTSGTATATKTEGMCAMHKVLAPKNLELGTLILETTTLATRFQLQMQVQPETAMYFPNPEKALGGFHSAIQNYEMRIDYTQHNLNSLLCMAKLLKEHEVAWNQ